MQRPWKLLLGVVHEQAPLLRPDEFARWQDDPTIVITYRDILACYHAKRGQGADKCRSVIMVGDGLRIERRIPSWQKAVHQRAESACRGEVLEKCVRAISAPGSEVRRIVNHQPKK